MEATKNQKISAAILWRMAQGETVREAFNAVIGPGAYEKLAGDVYDALRAKAGK